MLCAPVGDDPTVEFSVVLEQRLQTAVALAVESVIHAVKRAHHRSDAGVHGSEKPRGVQFSPDALRDIGREGFTVALVVVENEMFDTGRDVVALSKRQNDKKNPSSFSDRMRVLGTPYGVVSPESLGSADQPTPQRGTGLRRWSRRRAPTTAHVQGSRRDPALHWCL